MYKSRFQIDLRINSSAADFANFYSSNVNMEANSVDPDQNAST